MSKKKLKHIAVIMDGNRTWAKKRLLPGFAGHTQGAKNVEKITSAALENGIKYITFYALSTENLKERSKTEIKHLFSIIDNNINNYFKLFMDQNVKFNLIGNLAAFPKKTQNILKDLKQKTKNNKKMVATFAFNYGGRDEIIRAIKRIKSVKRLQEKNFDKYLDTHDIPDVDLLIRTGGFKRLSNFLLWQSAYAELYFTDVLWPSFSKTHLKKAIKWFHAQERKKGR